MSILFPGDMTCNVCGAEVFGGVCRQCTLEHNDGDTCNRCGRAVKSMADYCETCKNRTYNFERGYSAFRYEGSVQKLLRRYKFDSDEYLAPVFAQAMGELYRVENLAADCIVPVPVSDRRRKERGFDHAGLIAALLALDVCVPVVDCLVKVRDTPPSFGATAADRAAAVRGSFGVLAYADIRGRKVLLLDDIFTTGATADECAGILKRQGAASVILLTAAATPQRAVVI